MVAPMAIGVPWYHIATTSLEMAPPSIRMLPNAEEATPAIRGIGSKVPWTAFGVTNPMEKVFRISSGMIENALSPPNMAPPNSAAVAANEMTRPTIISRFVETPRVLNRPLTKAPMAIANAFTANKTP